jgi:hypothetical protein
LPSWRHPLPLGTTEKQLANVGATKLPTAKQLDLQRRLFFAERLGPDG